MTAISNISSAVSPIDDEAVEALPGHAPCCITPAFMDTYTGLRCAPGGPPPNVSKTRWKEVCGDPVQYPSVEEGDEMKD